MSPGLFLQLDQGGSLIGTDGCTTPLMAKRQFVSPAPSRAVSHKKDCGRWWRWLHAPC
jgi:hypothetical protein